MDERKFAYIVFDDDNDKFLRAFSSARLAKDYIKQFVDDWAKSYDVDAEEYHDTLEELDYFNDNITNSFGVEGIAYCLREIVWDNL